MSDQPKPTTLAPAPESLAAALASAGLDVQLAVSRKDGAPLSDNDLAAVRAMVACADIEAGREVSDDEAAAIAAKVTAPATGAALPLAS